MQRLNSEVIHSHWKVTIVSVCVMLHQPFTSRVKLELDVPGLLQNGYKANLRLNMCSIGVHY